MISIAMFFTRIFNSYEIEARYIRRDKRIKGMGCKCENVDFGTYANAVVLIYPFPTVRYPVVGTKQVQIDKCIAIEIIELWNMGIETEESCCGHNKVHGYVCVDAKFKQRMIDLGYEVGEKDNVYIPKSVGVNKNA